MQFSRAERIVPFTGVVKRPSVWLQVIIQNARLRGPPGSVTRDTRTKSVNPRLFLSIPVQVEKSVSLRIQKWHTSLNILPSQIHLRRLLAAASLDKQNICLSWVHCHVQLCPAPPKPPFPENLGSAFCRHFSSPAPQRYLHVLYCKLWTRNGTIFMLLDTERKSLS